MRQPDWQSLVILINRGPLILDRIDQLRHFCSAHCGLASTAWMLQISVSAMAILRARDPEGARISC
jgi:hypothetical protein